MEHLALPDLIDDLLTQARSASSGRHSQTIHGGHEHALRQTVLGLVGGQGLATHESPGEATLQVLAGRIRFVAGEDSCELGAGAFLVIPPSRHSVDALEDSVFLLSVAVQPRQ